MKHHVAAPSGSVACDRCGTFVSLLDLAEQEPRALCAECSSRVRSVPLFPYPLVLGVGVLLNATTGLVLAAINYRRTNDLRRARIAIFGAIVFAIVAVGFQFGALALQTVAHEGRPVQILNVFFALEVVLWAFNFALAFILTRPLKAVWDEHKISGRRAEAVVPVILCGAAAILMGSPSVLLAHGIYSITLIGQAALK